MELERVLTEPFYTTEMANAIIGILLEKYESGSILGRFTVKSPPYAVRPFKLTINRNEERDKTRLYCVCRKVYDSTKFVDILFVIVAAITIYKAPL